MNELNEAQQASETAENPYLSLFDFVNGSAILADRREENFTVVYPSGYSDEFTSEEAATAAAQKGVQS